MNERNAVRRLRAHQLGAPVPTTSTIHHHLANPADQLIVAFVRMGGESSPWGVAWGHPGQQPRIATAPEPRNRDEARRVITPFALDLLDHLRVPPYTDSLVDGHEDLLPLRQVWLPNGSHLDMVHALGFTYARTKAGGEDREMLNAFGRACGWLLRESDRPGQQSVITATSALTGAWAFPAQDSRCGHLGFLLGWLGAGPREQRTEAARSAEQRPIGTSLDPSFERDHLAPLVAAWNDDGESHRPAAAEAIHDDLEPELRHRCALVVAAISAIVEDERPVNAGVERLVATGARRMWFDLVFQESGLGTDYGDQQRWFTAIETDRNPESAAKRYFVQTSSEDLAEALMVHDDDVLLAEMVADGDALRGHIADVVDVGEGRAKRPVWTVSLRDSGPTRRRVGDRLCVRGLEGRTATLRRIEEDEDGPRVAVVEVTGLVTKPRSAGGEVLAATSAELIGTEVALVPAAFPLGGRKIGMVRKALDAPGAWVTHAIPGGPRSVVHDGDFDDRAERGGDE